MHVITYTRDNRPPPHKHKRFASPPHENHRYLLFLRHVQRIEMYTVNSTDTAPVLRYSVEVTKRDPPNGWLALPSFVSGPANRPLSKEAFYSKLGQTPDSAFPKVQQLVTITFREEAVRVNGGRGGGATPALTADSSSESEGENVDVGGSESESELVEITESTPVAASASKGATSIVDVFLMCAAIGGGEARKMACLPEHRHMKLIPWGGVRCGRRCCDRVRGSRCWAPRAVSQGV